MIGVNLIEQYRQDRTISQYNAVLMVVSWQRPQIAGLKIPITILRFLVNPNQAFGQGWAQEAIGWITNPEKWAVFANEPDLEGPYPDWYDQAIQEWRNAGGLVIEPAYHDERARKDDTRKYDAISWHCYQGDFENRKSVLARRNGNRRVFGTEYAHYQRQDQCLRELAQGNVTEDTYLFAWEWPANAPDPGYTLRGLELDKPMAGSVIIQAGHINIGNNCDHSLRGETGASHGPNDLAEQIINDYVAKRVVSLLMDAGVWTVLADANYNCLADANVDHSAVVALHCQSNPPNESGFDVGVGDPKSDGAAAESAKLAENLAAQYEAATGLPRTQWCQDNQNVQQYYLFGALTKNTPFALVEMCNADVDWDWANKDDHRDRMAYGVANAVLGFLGQDTLKIPKNASPVAPQPSQETTKQEVQDAINDVRDALTKLGDAVSRL